MPLPASGLRTRVPPQAERVFAHLAEKSDSQGDIRKAVYLQDLQNRRVPMHRPPCLLHPVLPHYYETAS